MIYWAHQSQRNNNSQSKRRKCDKKPIKTQNKYMRTTLRKREKTWETEYWVINSLVEGMKSTPITERGEAKLLIPGWHLKDAFT